MRKLSIIMALTICVLYLAGCQTTEPETTTPITTEPVIEPAPTTTTEDTSTGIEGEISDIGTLDEDLGLDDLENIDSELDDITW